MKFQHPKITIVTPSYNQGQFLEQTITSVIRQDYDNIEYIVIDGGSTDDSVDVIRRYEKYISYWQSQPDGGQADAIYKGFEIGTGSVLAWLNSDDYYLPGAIEQMVETFRSYPDAVSVYGDYQLLYPNGEIEVKPRIDFNWKICLHAHMIVPQQSWFFTRHSYDAVGKLDRNLQFAMDYDLLLRLGQYGKVQHARKSWSTYRLEPGCKTMRQAKAADLEMRKVKSRYGIDYTRKYLRKTTTKFYLAMAWGNYLRQRKHLIIRRSVHALQEQLQSDATTPLSAGKTQAEFSLFFRELAHEALNRGLKLVVLKEYETLPERLVSRDIDLVIDKSEISKWRSMILTVSQNLGLDYKAGTEFYYFKQQLIGGIAGSTDDLEIDLIPVLNWRGTEILNTRAIIERSIEHRENIWRTHPVDDCLIKFLLSYLYGGFVKERYVDSMSAIARENEAEIRQHLSFLFGKEKSDKIVVSMITKDFREISQQATKYRICVLIRGFLRHPLTFVYTFLLGYYLEFRDKVLSAKTKC